MNWLFILLILLAFVTGSIGLGIAIIGICVLWNFGYGLYRYVKYGEV